MCDITTWIPGLVEGEGTDYVEQGRTFSLNSIGDNMYSISYSHMAQYIVITCLWGPLMGVYMSNVKFCNIEDLCM